MDENHNNNNSIVVQQKQDLLPLKGLKISSSEEVPDDVELLKDGNKEATKINFESTQQARQLKEAGSSTLSANVATKDVNTSTLKGCPGDDTSNFKPANETQDDGDTRGNTTGEAREGSSDEGDTHNFSKNATLDKTLSYDEGATLIRERFLKNSTKAQSQNFQNGKSVEITLDHPKSEGNPAIGDSSSGKSLTNSTRKEEKTRRNRVKPNYSLEMAKTSHAKKRFEESPKSPEEAPPAPPRQISKSKAKEICLNWIKSLIALEAKTNMEDDKELPDAEVSEYCSNKM